MKFSNDYNLIAKYDGTRTKGLKIVDMEKYGLSNRWYGGNLKHVGEIDGSPILLMLGKNNKTIAVAVDDSKAVVGLTEYEAGAFKLPFIRDEEDGELGADEYTRKELMEMVKGLGGGVSGRENKADLLEKYHKLSGN